MAAIGILGAKPFVEPNSMDMICSVGFVQAFSGYISHLCKSPVRSPYRSRDLQNRNRQDVALVWFQHIQPIRYRLGRALVWIGSARRCLGHSGHVLFPVRARMGSEANTDKQGGQLGALNTSVRKLIE